MDLFGVTDLLTRSPTFERAREQISAPGTRPIIGVPDSAKAAAIAALIAGADAPVLVLTARPHRAEALAEEIAVWLGGGLPMLPFPERSFRAALLPSSSRPPWRSPSGRFRQRKCVRPYAG